LRAAAVSTLKANVIIGRAKGPKWSGYEPNDIHLEAVSLSPDDEKNSVFCSVTISAKGITERMVYVVAGTLGSWNVKFGGRNGPATGGHKLFPEEPIIIEPKGIPGPCLPEGDTAVRLRLQCPKQIATRDIPPISRLKQEE
jgi:hypothetical protein